MSKLYLIAYLFGEMVFVAGPTPYGLDECYKRAEQMQERFAASLQDPEKLALLRTVDNRISKSSDMSHNCEFHETRPKLKDSTTLK